MPVRTSFIRLSLRAALASAAGGMAHAQTDQAADSAAEAPAEAEAAAPQEQGQEQERPRTYVAETHGDWQVRCIEVADQPDPCQLFQQIDDQNGGPLAEVTLTLLPDGNAGISLLTPLETLLTENVRLTVDSGQTKVYPFTFCTSVGCFSRIGLTPEDIASYKAGNSVTLRIVPMRAPDQEVTASISLSGFTAAFNALSTER